MLPAPAPSPYQRLFAAIYDPVLALGELVGLRRRRAALLAGAQGRVLELGAGTGLNLRHYPEGVETLVLTEPDPAMLRRLTRRAARARPAAEVVAAGAERLPFADASVDTVVATLVLCTVDDPRAALAEVARVLRPGGTLLFLEHVLAATPRLARWQHRLREPWRRFACGCRCDRATVELLRDCGYAVDAVDRTTWRGMPAIVRPLAIGRATPRRLAAG